MEPFRRGRRGKKVAIGTAAEFFSVAEELFRFGRYVLSGNYPFPPPGCSCGIIGLEENLEKIYGAQSVAGKILVSKNLAVRASCRISSLGRLGSLAQQRGLADDRAIAEVAQGQMSQGRCYAL